MPSQLRSVHIFISFSLGQTQKPLTSVFFKTCSRSSLFMTSDRNKAMFNYEINWFRNRILLSTAELHHFRNCQSLAHFLKHPNFHKIQFCNFRLKLWQNYNFNIKNFHYIPKSTFAEIRNQVSWQNG